MKTFFQGSIFSLYIKPVYQKYTCVLARHISEAGAGGDYALILKAIQSFQFQTKKRLTGSEIARGGYKEEKRMCMILKTNSQVAQAVLDLVDKPRPKTDPKVLNNRTKTDIKWGSINIQHKKKTSAIPGQVDRRWVSQLHERIPMSVPVKKILTDLCEIPLDKKDPRYVDREKSRIKLTLKNYTQHQLDLVINYFRTNKKQIVECTFLGCLDETKPDILSATLFNKYIYVWKMNDVVDYLCTQPVKIRPSQTVIEIGDCFHFQRKGGDSKKKSGNHCQFKLDLSKLYESTKPTKYKAIEFDLK